MLPTFLATTPRNKFYLRYLVLRPELGPGLSVTMNKNTLTLQRKIMRRIYFIFAVRVIKHPITLQVGTMALALVLFADFNCSWNAYVPSTFTPMASVEGHDASKNCSAGS